MSSSETILIIGLGNPILGDDGIGWVVAREVEARLQPTQTSIEVEYLALGGLSLMERMVGYQYVILIDALNTGQRPQGAVITFTLDALVDLSYGHTTAAHDTSLRTALNIGRQLGASLPEDKDVHIVAIEAQHVYDFKEELSPAVEAAKPVAVEQVLNLLKSINHLKE